MSTLTRLLKDPPPEMVFEIAPDAVRMARTGGSAAIHMAPLEPGAISPSPLHENIALPEPLNRAIAQLAPPAKGHKRRTAAVLLPDHSAHLAVVDFTGFPENRDEQLGLIRARLRRSVPFEIEGAALSYWLQDGGAGAGAGAAGLVRSVGKKGAAPVKTRREVVVAVTPQEIVQRYEAPFRQAGIHPGFVTLASLACLALVENRGIAVVARLSGHVLTVLVQKDKALKLIRSIELSDAVSTLDEISSHLFQSFVYVEDNLGQPAQELLLAGFGPHEAPALEFFPGEFGFPVRALGGADTGIRGYLAGAAA